MRSRGISPVISTVIITAALLAILVAASFFAVNMLEIQIQRSEFEQAKTAMLLLDRTIVDVSLKRGAVSSVQFNQRSGGIGVYEGDTFRITILSNSGTVLWDNLTTSYAIKYRGGSMTTAAQMNLTNPGGPILEDPSSPLGYVRVEVGKGAWIVLDYNRVRVMENHSLKVIEISLIRLIPGRFGGLGTVTVRVENKGINLLFSRSLSGNLTIQVQVGDRPPAVKSLSLEGVYTVRALETLIEVSIM